MSWKGKTWQIYFVAKRVWVSSLVVFVSEPYQIITWHVGKVLCCWNFHSTTLSKFGRKSTRGCQFCSDLGGRSLTRCHPSIDNFTPCAQPPRIRENPSSIAEGLEKYFLEFWEKKNIQLNLPDNIQTSQPTEQNKQNEPKNIARGTTDPEIDSVTWIKFINNMAPLALVAYLATRWRHLH